MRNTLKDLASKLIVVLQVILLSVWWLEAYVELPAWLRVAGRLHPAFVHLPIGILVFGFLLISARSALKKRVFRATLHIVLLIASITSVIAAILGLLLSKESDYGTSLIAQHKVSGVLLSVSCYVLFVIYDRSQKPTLIFNWIGVAVMITLLFTGHTGSLLTHGENYLMAPLDSLTSSQLSDGSVYQEAILPVLEKKCISCHNETKAKGKLVMTNQEDFMRGGKKGKEWVDGNPGESRMIRYVQLPLTDKMHMPPDGKTPLTPEEIKLLEYWIKAGPDFTIKVNDLEDGDSLKKLVLSGTSRVRSKQVVLYADMESVSEKTIAELNSPFCSVFRLYKDSPALQADFFIRESFQKESLTNLQKVIDQLVVLNLSRMPVEDNDLATIGTFKNLEKLNLNFTDVKGAGLANLKNLSKLASLSLAGTHVTADDIRHVLPWPSLHELFIWNTSVTEDERKELVSQFPSVRIETTQFKDNRILRLSKPSVVKEVILKKDEAFALRSPMSSTTIRYTLDDSTPDSVSSKIYEGPISVAAPFSIKAIATKTGWYSSDVMDATVFVEGVKPLAAELMTKPDKQYPGEGAAGLIDGRKGFLDVFKEPAWLGYRDQALEAGFEFGAKAPVIRSIVISHALNTGSYIFPPMEAMVWGGADQEHMKLLTSMKPVQPTQNEPTRMKILTIPLPGEPMSYYKLVLKPVPKLPTWHSGKGSKGWIMVDEVFFYTQ